MAIRRTSANSVATPAARTMASKSVQSVTSGQRYRYAWANYSNRASGGTVTEYVSGGRRYRLHTFTANATFQVDYLAGPFRVLLQGAGAGGGYGLGGGHGEMTDTTTVTQFGTNANPCGPFFVSIGTGGAPYNRSDNVSLPGGDGTATSIGALSAAGGISRGAVTGAGASSDITGSSVQYGGAGAQKIINDVTVYTGSPNGGGNTGVSGSFYGAGGGGQQLGSAGTGYQGVAYVRYEILAA